MTAESMTLIEDSLPEPPKEHVQDLWVDDVDMHQTIINASKDPNELEKVMINMIEDMPKVDSQACEDKYVEDAINADPELKEMAAAIANGKFDTRGNSIAERWAKAKAADKDLSARYGAVGKIQRPEGLWMDNNLSVEMQRGLQGGSGGVMWSKGV